MKMKTTVNMKTVEAIINGSRKIDEMRKRICETVKMLNGLVNKKSYNKVGVFGLMIYTNSNMFWKIKPSNIHRRGFIVETPTVTESFHVEAYISENNKPRLIFSEHDSSVLNYHDVQLIYDNLHMLLSGMMEIFPEIERKIKPFLEASEVEL
ncbi:MAG: hypothetical protein M0P76_06015 [Candidatus Pacebacteria bacterium]|jgi:hypothetical protein|nr:hypothetical protein [Candidatus Paceibacterota bacterium]